MPDRYFGGRPPINTDIKPSQLDVQVSKLEHDSLESLQKIVDYLGTGSATFEELVGLLGSRKTSSENTKFNFTQKHLRHLIEAGFLEKNGNEFSVTDRGLRRVDELDI